MSSDIEDQCCKLTIQSNAGGHAEVAYLFAWTAPFLYIELDRTNPEMDAPTVP